eukprot:COSAG01_NODE_957_length_12474_cov_44.298182_3_plen_136_part_00
MQSAIAVYTLGVGAAIRMSAAALHCTERTRVSTITHTTINQTSGVTLVGTATSTSITSNELADLQGQPCWEDEWSYHIMGIVGLIVYGAVANLLLWYRLHSQQDQVGTPEHTAAHAWIVCKYRLRGISMATEVLN